jgi:hypothetical protein
VQTLRLLPLLIFISLNCFGQYGSNFPVATSGDQTITGAKNFDASVAFKGPNPWADVTRYGLVGDGSTDNTTAFNTLTASACTAGIKTLWFPSPGNYVFKSKPTAIHCGLWLVSPMSLGATYSFGSFITATYNTGSATEGFLEWDGANAGTQGNGGGMWGINVLVNAANTAGALIKLTGTSCTARAGDMLFEGFKLGGGGGGNSSYGFYIDGSACTTSGTQGLRDIHISFVLTFNTTVNSLKCINCAHFYWANGVTSPGTGVGDASFTGTGSGTAATSDATLDAVSIFGNLALDFTTQFLLNGVITGTVSCTGNTTNSAIFGDFTPPSTPCAGVSTFPSLGTVHQANGPIIANSGGATAFTGTCPAGAFCTNTGSAGTQGTIFFGNTSNIFRMQNGNAFLSWDGGSHQPFFCAPVGATGANCTLIGTLLLSGATSGNATLAASATAGGTHTFPNNTGTVAETNLAQTFSAQQALSSNNAVLTSDFTTANASGFQTITGLGFTLAASTAQNVPFECDIMYSQATVVSDSFGIQDVTIAPTRLDALGVMGTSTTAYTTGNLANLTTTTATAIVTATPTVTTVNSVHLSGVIQQPSNASSSAVNIMVSQSTAANVIVIKAGSMMQNLVSDYIARVL